MFLHCLTKRTENNAFLQQRLAKSSFYRYSDLQESSRQLAQGFEQMSRELGRISRYMGDQDRRSREVQA